MSWESEVEIALVSAVTGAGAITTLLTDASAFYRERPFQDAGYPQLTYSWQDQDAQNLSGHGKLTVTLEIDIWAAVGALDAIRYALQDELDERLRLANGASASPITMANWDCKHFRYLHSRTTPTGTFSGDANSSELVQRTTTWEVRLYAK